MRYGWFCRIGLAVCSIAGSAGSARAEKGRVDAPDVLLIVADDLGFSDLGCYGGEIPTPHLDALAARGLRFSQFYNSARCSPSRAALLTGLHPHEAGMGMLAEDPLTRAPAHAGPGYRRFLAPEVQTLPERLQSAGFATALSGKWHLGAHGEEKWPLARGFAHFYGILYGSSSYHRPVQPRGFVRQNKLLAPPEDGFYATDAIATDAIGFLRERGQDERFFLLLSFTAPHWPLHARDEDIARFVGTYQTGWDRLRRERFARQQALGVVPAQAVLSPRDDAVRAWMELSAEEQRQADYRMAVYAAQVHRMDFAIGQVVESLRELGRLDRTLIVFLSDNGASAEPYTELGGGPIAAVNDPAAGGLGGQRDPGGGSSYGIGWANLSNTPFRRYKSRLYEGGVRTPAIVHWPAGLRVPAGSITPAPAYVTELWPTILELCETAAPATTSDATVATPRGRSLVPVLQGQQLATEPELYWEQYGHRAVRRGDWKAVRTDLPGATWELYDLANDPTELHDQAGTYPARLSRLTAAWESWASSAQVFPVTVE